MELSDEPSTKKPKKSKSFQHQWYDTQPEWRKWVKECSYDSTKYVCDACGKTLSCGISDILRHSQSDPHRKNMHLKGFNFDNAVSGSVVPPVVDSFSSDFSREEVGSISSPPELNFSERVRAAEIRFAAFVAENNIPLAMAPKILKLFKCIGKEPAVLQAMEMGKTKTTGIINKVVSVHESQRIIENLQKTKFSVYVDETSDITGDKWMTLMVRYVNPETILVKTELLQLIHVNAVDCSAEALFKEFSDALAENKVPFDNIISFACDNASVMVGDKNSFKTRMVQRLPNILTLPCICHSLAIIAKDACSAIPEDVHRFVTGVPTFINGSPKRAALYRDFQITFDHHPSKILKFAPTRWLSRQIAIGRILDNWSTIHVFLTDQARDKSATAVDLLDIMNKPMTKAYLLFLRFALASFNKINAYFQGSDTLVQQLQPSSTRLLREILQRFLKPLMLKPEIFNKEARNIDFSRGGNQFGLFEIDIGADCKNYLIALQSSPDGQNSDINKVRYNCLQFYLRAAQQIRERLPFDNIFLSDLTVLEPETALLDSDRETSFSRLKNVCRTLGVLEEVSPEEEWRSLFCADFNLIKRWRELSFDQMWVEICTFVDSDGIIQFPALRKLLSIVRVLPHSNAAAERAFSLIPDVKTKKRNSLNSVTLNSICVLKAAAKSRNESASEMVVDRTWIDLMSSCHLYSRNSKLEVKNECVCV
ncbi:zinc finger protein 862-like [Venturia canescens]|uniref:zinc finger protein 862-like n=1 Tax=Venturia canescens TaxID=32260 RepID=UPI001C9D0B97|nr:zinc finger protein 862-like [Venturia canescens]